VRSRLTASGTLFAEVTIGVDDGMSVVDAHRLADAVESRIAAAYGVAEVTVHVEPA
jgi:ferrous-iron efflux pump FieF